MYDRVVEALQTDQLQQAATLLRQWRQQAPSDPWLGLALGQYWHLQGDLDRARAIYRSLLQTHSNPRILTQARGSLQRLEQQHRHHHQQALQRAREQPGAATAAILALPVVAAEQRAQAAQGLAQVTQLDLYTARQRLSSQHWRLYRVGPLAELAYLGEQLTQHQVPCRWVAVETLKGVPVLRVVAILAFAPQISLLVQLPEGPEQPLKLDWSEVSQWLIGQLPLYESVVDLAPWGKLKRRETIQDYAEIIDWHLPGRGCILRFCDRTYRHQHSCPPPNCPDQSGRLATIAWSQLKDYFRQRLQTAAITDFSGFGAGALELIPMLPPLAIALDLSRPAPCPWDDALHLYSALRFWHLNSP